MSKPDSGHFKGTIGSKNAMKYLLQKHADSVMIHMVGVDTRPHPTKYKQLNSKKLKILREKVKTRTITKAEYKHLDWQRRLTIRRNEGIKQFWINERKLIKHHLATTRNWSAEQRRSILAGKRPIYKGRPMISHHMYSVAKYPHLANRREFIYPVTIYEHLSGWHGGNTRKSLPGIPIKPIKEF